MRRIKGQTGMSLVEALIILLVLMLLTGVLAPNIFEFVKDAQEVKVKEDCEAIGIEIAKLVRDVGPCLKLDGAGRIVGPPATDSPCTVNTQAQLLWSDGTVPALGAGAALPAFTGNNWDDQVPAVGTTLESQLITNGPTYLTIGEKGNFNHNYPSFGLGWRGAYISGPIGPDPWGGQYLVNPLFLTAAAYNGTPMGFDYDVFCISSGQNLKLDTPIQVDGVAPGLDDFVFVIQGSTR